MTVVFAPGGQGRRRSAGWKRENGFSPAEFAYERGFCDGWLAVWFPVEGRDLPVWLACFGSGGVGSGGFLCWRRGMGGFFGGWRAIWLGTHGFGGRVLCCWGDVEAAVVAAGLASRGRMGIAGVACLFQLRWSWFRRLFMLAAEVWAVWRGRTDLLRGLVWSVLQEGGDGGAMAGMARRCRF